MIGRSEGEREWLGPDKDQRFLSTSLTSQGKVFGLGPGWGEEGEGEGEKNGTASQVD